MPAATTVVSASNLPKQLSDGNGQGTIMGYGPLGAQGGPSADMIAFFGATPIVQPSGANEALVTPGQAGAIVATFATSQAPSSVTSTNTAEKTLTVMASTAVVRPIAGDLVFVNKPTSQTGIGIGNVRVSGANSLGVTFDNYGSTTITPTNSEVYGVVAMRGFPTITLTISPAVVLANTTVEQTFACTPLRTGELVQVSKPSAQAGIDIAGCRVVSANVLGITFCNPGSVSVTPTASEGYTVFSIPAIDTASNTFEIEANVGTLVGMGNGLTALVTEQNVTVTGLATTDTVMGISKPTVQTSLAVVGQRVASASTLGIAFMTTSATATPTASEVYGVSVFRPSPAAPLVIYTQTLTPASVSALTTGEQTFTVTGLVSGSAVWVNKPSATQGLGILGVRVSSANTLAINYANTSSAAIVPPAEAYVIGNFQQAIPDNGNAFVFGAMPAQQFTRLLSNATRTALVNLGLLAGA